jgi:superfamily II DNA or RNA helicase
LSERIEHLETLKQMLEQSVENVFIIHGKTKIKDRNETLQKLKDLSEKPFVLLAISKGIGEGFDLPALRTLFITAPFSADYRVIQYTGRIERKFENKDTIKVYDYVDSEIRMVLGSGENHQKVSVGNSQF